MSHSHNTVWGTNLAFHNSQQVTEQVRSSLLGHQSLIQVQSQMLFIPSFSKPQNLSPGRPAISYLELLHSLTFLSWLMPPYVTAAGPLKHCACKRLVHIHCCLSKVHGSNDASILGGAILCWIQVSLRAINSFSILMHHSVS